jgi:ABC-type multidrug transport system ATPase subunit/pSer/pThr/pTyr-binding forkhead associated (FHA) protein/ABC-type multidrug transport system permease subunit
MSDGQTTFFKIEEQPVSNLSVITIFDGISKPVETDLSRFGKNIISFGRDERNDIVIQSKFVSRQHGYFKFINGVWVIENNPESLNGLMFDGKRINNKILHDGDNIRIDNDANTSVKGVLITLSSKGAANWQNYALSGKSEILIGRGENCDIRLEHISVSKLHAKIVRKDSVYYLTDNDSKNGITVNGRKVNGRTRLNEKDIILITNSKLIISSEAIAYCCYKDGGFSVESQKIVKKVSRNKIICDNVDLFINQGEMIAIVGGSGAGKTTVMNCLSGYSQPTDGRVLVNNVDLYENFETLKNIIGYVPQSDIVYDNLTVIDMLRYAAKLRLPKDISKVEFIQIIDDSIEKVELTNNKDTLIKNLSGGQRKRASIAVELLSNPNLFFLDEPASGLDPGTEQNLMHTLRKMAAAGKTIIFVTHSTLNLNLCDKIVFMGKGGKLCFYGSYNEALEFFGVTNIVDVYNMITNESEQWKQKFNATQKNVGNVSNSNIPNKKTSTKFLSGSLILCKRNLHTLINDRIRLLLILLQAPLLAMLISIVADGNQFDDYRITRSLLFALSCSAFWIGILNSIQEVCKERNILKREYMAGLRLDSYIVSKLAMLAIVCAIQSLMLTTVVALTIGLPDFGVFTNAYIEFLITVYLTAISASSIGIFVSSLFKNADRAMTVAPILLMPQLLFSGMIFELSGASNYISFIITCRWSMQGLGTTANLNSLDSITKEGLRISNEFSNFYEFTVFNLVSMWTILFSFVIVFSIFAMLILRNINYERKK